MRRPESRQEAALYGLAGLGAVQGLLKYYRPQPSTLAWGCLAAGIIAYEIKAPEGQLMSEAADRLIDRHPVLAPLAIEFLGGMITNHLANKTRPSEDLLHNITEVFKHGTST
jgi:hypothetical protein